MLYGHSITSGEPWGREQSGEEREEAGVRNAQPGNVSER